VLDLQGLGGDVRDEDIEVGDYTDTIEFTRGEPSGTAFFLSEEVVEWWDVGFT
jgi:hypothetical protein